MQNQREVTLAASSSAASSQMDVHDIDGDWSLRVLLEGPAEKVQLSIQDSVDAFTTSRTLAVVNPVAVDGRNEFTFRAYQLSSARVGVVNGKLRLSLQSIGSGSINSKLIISY